jgi:hypothetical protein
LPFVVKAIAIDKLDPSNNHNGPNNISHRSHGTVSASGKIIGKMYYTSKNVNRVGKLKANETQKAIFSTFLIFSSCGFFMQRL